MAKNVVQMHAAIKAKIDFTGNPRHASRDYDKAINEAIEQIVNDRYDNIKKQLAKQYSVESIQRVRDELYTLIVSATITPAADIAAYPAATYKHLLMMSALINTVARPVRARTYDEYQELILNSFAAPDEENPIFLQESTGFKLYYGSGNTLGDVTLYYMKHPAVVNRGLPDEEISSGTGVISSGVDYIVTTDATIHNSITYYIGEIFTSADTNLAAGSVVLRSLTTDCYLPDTAHKEVIDEAATIMEGWVDDYPSKQSLDFDANKS